MMPRPAEGVKRRSYAHEFSEARADVETGVSRCTPSLPSAVYNGAERLEDSVHDLVIRNGKVVDGTGRDAFRADVAIDGEIVSAVGEVEESGWRTIDADGLVVTPGFIDPTFISMPAHVGSSGHPGVLARNDDGRDRQLRRRLCATQAFRHRTTCGRPRERRRDPSGEHARQPERRPGRGGALHDRWQRRASLPALSRTLVPATQTRCSKSSASARTSF